MSVCLYYCGRKSVYTRVSLCERVRVGIRVSESVREVLAAAGTVRPATTVTSRWLDGWLAG